MLRSLSIIVPAFNEESRLPESLNKLLTWIKSADLEFAEILVVDDGSADGTAALVESMSASVPVIRLLRNGENRGKGYSVKNGMSHLNGEWVLVTDAGLIGADRRDQQALRSCHSDEIAGSDRIPCLESEADRSAATYRPGVCRPGLQFGDAFGDGIALSRYPVRFQAFPLRGSRPDFSVAAIGWASVLTWRIFISPASLVFRL